MKAASIIPLATAVALLLGGCAPDQTPAQSPRPVRTALVRFDTAHAANRYVGTVQSRYEVDQAFRVGGKVAQRRVDVGQVVREGDVIAVLDATDYRLAEEAARQSLVAATTASRQAASDRERLAALKADGSVSASDDEHARSGAEQAQAAAEAEARKLELARNRLRYTELRASRGGVVTQVRLEVGQVVAEGQPVVSIADPGVPEVVIDVPEDHAAAFRAARFRASIAAAPDEYFEVALRELSPQAATLTRTFRARLKPTTPRALPLGATATLVAERASDTPLAALPASALTQAQARPAVWLVRADDGKKTGSVDLVPVAVHAYRNDEVLVAGLPEGGHVVTAGVQKMSPGLQVSLLEAPSRETKIRQASR